MRKVIKSFLIVLIFLILSACTGDTSDEVSDSSQESSKEVSTDSTSSPKDSTENDKKESSSPLPKYLSAKGKYDVAFPYAPRSEDKDGIHTDIVSSEEGIWYSVSYQKAKDVDLVKMLKEEYIPMDKNATPDNVKKYELDGTKECHLASGDVNVQGADAQTQMLICKTDEFIYLVNAAIIKGEQGAQISIDQFIKSFSIVK